MLRLTRLRWQLILSHLTAIVFTLVAMVGAVVLVAGMWLPSKREQVAEPALEARAIAQSIDGMVARGASPGDLDVVLRALASGELHVFSWSGSLPPPGSPPSVAWPGLSSRDPSYIVVVGPDGQPVASSGPGGASFTPPERPEWDALARAALSGTTDPRRLAALRPGGSPAALGAAAIRGNDGRPLAAVIVATPSVAPSARGPSWSGLAFVGAASIGILALASLFALVPASIVGYMLSRRLVSRLERLGRAVESLAAGDLSQRVEAGPPDEVGQLVRRFNHMADRLAASVADLEAARARMEEALRAKRELVANVSHELRTPLALIRGYVESLALREETERERAAYLTVVNREVEHLSRLVDDLFALSTAEAGALPLNIEPVALGEVVGEVVGGIAPIAQRERQVGVVAQVAPNLPPALADRQRVVQVLGNLVRNALRYTPEGGLVAVRAERQAESVAVTVEDTGEGIEPERLAHVFERFYRGDDARDRASGGAGLGLAIVRELVEAMGGEVSVESVVGQGSRFAFRLPLAGVGSRSDGRAAASGARV